MEGANAASLSRSSTSKADTKVEDDAEKGDHGPSTSADDGTSPSAQDNTQITSAADWSSPTDPDNPYNWPMFKRAYHMFAPGTLAFAVTAGTSLVTPAAPQIAAEFGVSDIAALLPLSLYTLGLAIGPCIAAPISETYGRSVVYKLTGVLCACFLVGCALAPNFAALLVCRLLAGTVGGPVLAVGSGTSADLFPPHNRAIATACFIMMPFLGPALGPIVGGFTAFYLDWRWTQWISLIFVGVSLFFVMPMHETYKKIILQRRARRLQIPGPPDPLANSSAAQRLKFLLTVTLLRPLYMQFTEPIVAFLSIYNAFNFAVVFAFFAAFPYTYSNVYNLNTWEVGLCFLGVLVGTFIATAIVIAVDRLWYARLPADLKRTPEHRLPAPIFSAPILTLGLLLQTVLSRDSGIHPTLSVIFGATPFTACNLIIFINSALYSTDVYGPLNGASAMAANAFARYIAGATLPLAVRPWFDTLGVGGAFGVMTGFSVLLIPIPWVLWKRGPQIRKRSKFSLEQMT